MVNTSPIDLPGLLVLTDAAARPDRPLIETVKGAISGGARAVLLREKHLSRAERAALVTAIRPLLAEVDGTLLIASDPQLPGDGVHLAATDPLPNGPQPFGRSCHSTSDVVAARNQGCSWATLSPIFPSPSKPGYGPALGPSSLTTLPLPVWALGGITSSTARACRQAGATGIAVMGAVMAADNPAAAVTELIGAWQDC